MRGSEANRPLVARECHFEGLELANGYSLDRHDLLEIRLGIEQAGRVPRLRRHHPAGCPATRNAARLRRPAGCPPHSHEPTPGSAKLPAHRPTFRSALRTAQPPPANDLAIRLPSGVERLLPSDSVRTAGQCPLVPQHRGRLAFDWICRSRSTGCRSSSPAMPACSFRWATAAAISPAR